MIVVFLILGLILRMISLNQSLWLDEATTAMVAKMSLSDIFTKFLPGDFHPPLYYLLLKLWTSIFGFSEIFLRMPSVIFGVGTIYLTYLVAKKVFNKQTALMSAVLLATSGLHIYYSQEARMYSMAAFLITLLFYLYLENKWILFSIIAAIAGMTDYVSLFVIPVFFILNRKNTKHLLLSLTPLILAFILWLPIFMKQLQGGFSQAGSNWWSVLGVLSFKNIALIPIKFSLGRISFDNRYLYGMIAMFIFLLFGYLFLNARETIAKNAKIFWLWLVIPVCVGIVLSFKIPTLSYFRFLFILPAFYILIASGLTKLGKYRKLFFALAISVNIFSSVYYLTNTKFQREDWRAAATAIGMDKIVFPANSQKEALIYYGKGSQIIMADDLITITNRPNEIWLSRYVWEVFDPIDKTHKMIESLSYNKVSENNFNGVVFWKYIIK